MKPRAKSNVRGFALLTVLGAIVVLSAVALALSASVRTELGAAHNRADALRAYYLARGGLEEALYLLTNAASSDVPTLRRLRAPIGGEGLRFDIAQGRTRVEIRSEAGKIDINQADEEVLDRLLRVIGVAPNQARAVAQAIIQWRRPRTGETGDLLDRYYRALPQPYPARHAAFATLEELLLVRGMSREILYGHFELTDEGEVIRRGGLIRQVTVHNSSGLIDANSASYEVLRVIGLSDSAARSVIAARRVKPFASLTDLQAVVPAEATGSKLVVGAGDFLELSATGEPTDSRVRHTLRALIKLDASAPARYRILAWYDSSPEWIRSEEAR